MPKIQTFDRHGNLVRESEHKIPTVEPTPPGSRRWPPSEFLLRLLLPQEVLAIDSSASTAVKMIKLRFLASTEPINLDSPEFKAAIDVLIEESILQALRREQILSGKPA